MDRSPELQAYIEAVASKGGKARAKALSKKRRSEIARIAGSAPKKKRRKP